MEKVKVTRNFQVMIPASFRKEMGIRIGNTLIADIQGGRIVLEKRKGDVTKMKLRLGEPFDWRDVEKTASEAAEITTR